LSDFEHPCQALADLMTIRERLGTLSGKILAYVGDGNNVAHSLLLAGAKTGMTVRVAAPAGFEPIPQVVQRASEIAEETGGAIETLSDPQTAVKGAHVLDTDVWARMGQEEEADARAVVFRPYQVKQALLDDAGIRAIPNVGKSIAEKVRSVLETGTFPELEELRAQVPAGVRAMTAIPGFGPKKAMVVYRELGIDGLDQLVAAARDGRLRGLKGFSAKTEQNVLQAVQRASRDT